MPGGYQPPFAQLQPGPGCTVLQAMDGAAGIWLAAPAGGVIPGGYQPPFAQVQSGAGCTVVQGALDATGA